MIITWAKFVDLPDSKKIYLAELTCAQASSPTTTRTVYFATTGRAFSNYYHPAIKEMPRAVRSLQEVFHGRSLPTWGELQLLREDGYLITPDGAVSLDHLIDGTWLIRGRTIRFLFGGEDLPYSEYRQIFTGTVDEVSWDNQRIVLRMKDLRGTLEGLRVTTSVIASGTNVPDASVGRVKPVCLGAVRRVKPILIESVARTYLVHDVAVGALVGITTVYDNGVSVGFTANLAAGTFTLSAAATGEITADVTGTRFGAASATVANLASGLVQLAGLSVDSSAITACNTDLPYTVGLFLDRITDIMAAIDALCGGLPVWYGFTRAGVFRIGEFKPPTGTAVHVLGTKNILAGSLSGKQHEELIWKQTISFDRTWSSSDEWKYASSESSAIKTSYPGAADTQSAQSCLGTRADAQAVAAKWLTLLGTGRSQYQLTVKPLGLQYELHDLASLTWPRFGLEAGRLLRIVAAEEDWLNNRVRLTLWG